MERVLRTVLTQLYVSVTIGSVWFAAMHYDWPGWVAFAARIAAAVALATAALFLSWWTRNLGDGLPFVERGIRIFVWSGVVGVALVASALDWRVGVQSLALAVFVAGKTWPEHLARFWAWLLATIAAPAGRPPMVGRWAPSRPARVDGVRPVVVPVPPRRKRAAG
jgi:hypothetical protein